MNANNYIIYIFFKLKKISSEQSEKYDELNTISEVNVGTYLNVHSKWKKVDFFLFNFI